MFKQEQKYHLGTKVFWYFLVTKNKILIAIFFILTAFSWLLLYGPVKSSIENWLLENISYLEVSILRQWAWMFGVAYLFIIGLRTSVLYKIYSFTFHKHAFHVSHGIFFVKEHVMPYSQIINVEIRRGVASILFGLVELDIITGLTEEELGRNKYGKRVSLIPIIDKNTAKEIAHKLMSLAALHNGYEPADNTTADSGQKLRQRRRR